MHNGGQLLQLQLILEQSHKLSLWPSNIYWGWVGW